MIASRRHNLRKGGARAPSEAAHHGAGLPFNLRLLGVGELHGNLELGGRVGVGVAGYHLRTATKTAVWYMGG